MGIGACELLVSRNEEKIHSYVVTVESGVGGFARLNVAHKKLYSDDYENAQGVDLYPSELRALAKMLSATADLIES
jgi:hypothetical protein